MARGETVKYVIDADTSGFSRGMTSAAIESGIAGRKIDKNLSKTARSSENNFKDIRQGAATAASSIRNFGIAFQGFNTTSAIVGITALTGVVLELSGALAAASSTALILVPALTQGVAAVTTFKTGIFGLNEAFKAIGKNDGEAFTESMKNLGPASAQVALAAGTLNKAFNGIRLNTQQALFAGIGDEMLKLGSIILPTLNAGMQRVAQSFNQAFKSASQLASTPIFQSLLATIFADTARNVQILSGALGPLLNIFTDLYLVTRPYVTLLSQQFVNLTKNLAAYLESANGQTALNLAIQEGLIALKQLGSLASSVFGLLTSVFRTAVNAGNSLIPTLTSIVQRMTVFVNSAEGQAKLIALFNFTSLAVQSVANAIGQALGFFFGLVQIVDSLNPAVQGLIINFLATALTLRPLLSYISQLYLAIRVLTVTIFNLVQQAIVAAVALGAFASIALVVAAGFIIFASIIRGPLGGALIIIGTAIAAYIGLSYLLSIATAASANAFYAQGVAALGATISEAELAQMNILAASTMYAVASAAAASGAGMSFAARAAVFLQTALVPLIVLAAGVLVILSMLGVFNSKTKDAQSATSGFGSSLSALQKAMKGVGAAGNKTSNDGLSALNTSLDSVGKTAEATTGSLASFDKMNVLTDDSTGTAGISGLPALPNLGTPSLGAPTLDTTDFDNAIGDMEKNFAGLQNNLAKPIKNPFESLGTWINTHIVPSLLIFGGIITAIAVAFGAFGFAAIAAVIGVSATIGLIVLAVVAVIAIIILLVKNWDNVWAAIKIGASNTWQFLQSVWDAIVQGVLGAVSLIGTFFSGVWVIIVDGANGAWNGIVQAFSSVGTFFGNVFNGAWAAIKNAFNNVISFFQGVWNNITSIFGKIGSTIGDAVGNAFKSAINAVLGFLEAQVNGIVNIINGALAAIDKITPGSLPRLDRVALPRLAKGGIINSPTVAQLGEAGQEAVMPLENNTEWIDKLANKINISNNAGNTSNNSHIPSRLNDQQQATNITVKVSGVFATSIAEQRKVADLIAKRISESTKSKPVGAF